MSGTINMLSKPPDNEAIRELRDTVKELNQTIKIEIKSTRRFSTAFMTLAFVQVTLGVAQLGIETLDPKYAWIRIVIFLAAMIILIYIIRDGLKN